MQIKALVGQAPSEVATPGCSQQAKAIPFIPVYEPFPPEVCMDFDPRWPDEPRDRDGSMFEVRLEPGQPRRVFRFTRARAVDPRDVFTDGSRPSTRA